MFLILRKVNSLNFLLFSVKLNMDIFEHVIPIADILHLSHPLPSSYAAEAPILRFHQTDVPVSVYFVVIYICDSLSLSPPISIPLPTVH